MLLRFILIGILALFSVMASDIRTTPRRGFGAAFDGGGVALVAGKTVYMTVVGTCRVEAYNIVVDAGTATFDVWRLPTGIAIPVVGNSILANPWLAITVGTALHTTVLAPFVSTVINANDVVAINLKTVAGATWTSVFVECN
jgi:hypothetical protein